ncbi:hypothetical protein SapgrDRAFT_2458 [Saprospira grandis DSM 2844]|uniref:CRISPR-associated protein n=1 Tax=Saprospira grandis DSM 2844 TaxID=694433 RepID=J0P991_9BACT|nr:hypothetical protein [Saprospira grandis]EJF54117.1 hypothetical protein SapgrDRAFT_2458 [Saprospira grandis DSM 2844]
MFLNLSNHPSSRWSGKQLTTAQQYGQLQDLPFPNIPPAATTAEVEEMAETYKNKVVQLAPKIVHLMGEMTFTACLARKLQAEGLQCVASTTERIVLEEEDGSKTVKFNFVQFRTYPNLLE